jgi:hypothetical protein
MTTTLNEQCEGVWLPDGTTKCFVEKFRHESDYELSQDHIVPRSYGGTDEPSNLHMTHVGCQNRQGGYISEAFRASQDPWRKMQERPRWRHSWEVMAGRRCTCDKPVFS